MTEQECLAKMVAPGTHRPGKYGSDRGFGGVIQVHLTRACDLACYNCTQASNVGGKTPHMTPDQFKAAVESLRGYPGIVGVFGGNPAMSPYFVECCQVLRESWVPFNQRGLWCNNPLTVEKACAARLTFDPSVSNLNVHMSRKAYDMFKLYWPESKPCGLTSDSRHSPPWVAMKDVVTDVCCGCDGAGNLMIQLTKKRMLETKGYSKPLTSQIDRAYFTMDGREIEQKTIGGLCSVCHGLGKYPDVGRIWELISGCDINQHWSAMIGVFRGELRAWFCEIAGAQAMLHQDEPDYPDTGFDPTGTVVADALSFSGDSSRLAWWQLPMGFYAHQVRKHCFDCGVPLRGRGENALTADEVGVEQVSATHADVYKPKRKERKVQVVAELVQLGSRLDNMTRYLQNSNR